MHQPVLDPISPFRRSSFGVEATLKPHPVASDAAQIFKEMLAGSNRPPPSRRASLRGVPHAPSFPPPPPPIVAAQVVDPTRSAPMLDPLPLHATTMRSPSPPIDLTRASAASRKGHHSPVRSPPPAPPPPPPPPPPPMSSPPRGNSSQAEYFMRSNGLSPPSASRRAYSFVRDQPVRPPVSGQHRAPPPRTNSCPPDADMFKTRMMRSNSDGYTSASTSFMTEGSTSPTSSASTHPSDSEDAADPRHPLHDKKKASECYPSSFNPTQLELESRRRDLLWRETEKQWKDKHGNTLSRAEDMAFRQKVERGVGQAEDGPQEKEWRDMWKTTDSYWNEFEARWRQDLAQRRSASRNDDGHFHTAHSDSRDMTSPDDDNSMTALMSSFEREMGEKRRVQRLSEVERAERKRREHEREAWKATLDREQEIRRPSSQGPEQERMPDTLHRSPDVWPQDRLRRPDVARTRSSSVVVDARPSFRRSRSGSLAAAGDILPTTAAVDPLPFETAPKFDEKPLRMKRHRPSRGSKESFDFLAPEVDPLRAAQAELHHADEAKQQYLAKARHHLQEELRMCDDSQREELIRAEKTRRAERREHERRSRGHPIETETDFYRSNEAAQRQRDATSPPPPSAKEPLPQQPLANEQVSPKLDTSSGSIQEHLLKLEAEQAALARRIQELRIAAEAAESAKLAQAEQDRGREREREREPERDQSQKTKTTEPRPKVQEARKRQSNEADVFKAMQERLRKVEEQRVPERTDAIPPKVKRSATVATFDFDSLTTPTDTRSTFVHSETEPLEGRVRFMPSRQSPDELRAPLPARPRTPGPGTRATTPARVRTPSPRSQSPVAQSGSSSIASSNATRDTSPGHEVESSVHEAVAPRSPKPQPAPSAHSVPRPAGRSREAGPSASTSERPKSGTATTVPGLNVPPHVNTSPPPIEVSHDQDASPVNAKTPRASSFDPDRTPRAQACPVPDASEKSEPTLAPPPLAYVSPSHFRARADEEPTTTKRRVDAAVGATVAAAAAETFDRAGSKKRNKDAELRAQEERRASEEQLAREQRRAEDERRREQQRAEEARKRDVEKREREREEQARQDRERRERQEQEERRRRWGEPTYERVSRQPSRSEPTPSIIDAWNSYELRWSALGVASSTQPITFRNIPWPLMRIPTGPESITPQAVGAFLLSPLHSQDKSRKERLRGAMLRWHSDKFEGRWMARIDESERAKVKEAVGAVARSLTELMTKPDLY